ncbi:hypothetical protein NLI96_g7059 [Meripilus lineatus]|uniref:laccase n=1 Tax=Meripilus lineatus TaxID=2056292 RepID=A0AAD5YDB1_9APHY|nr:hypothetical protein NLI96_g7059 [Physisporinus lineatus]
MSAFTWLLFLSCLTFAPVANAHTAIGPVADLVLTNENIAPDGHPRIAAVAGGMMPGPLIRGNKVCHGFRSLRYVDSSTTGVQGDRFQINVHDQLTDDDLFTPTSIHWHGLFQHGTNWADGVAMVTQCPIVTGSSFLYNFTVPGQAGTFWYHSHLSTQYCDGLRGPLVVYDPKDPHKGLYDVDDESTIISLTEWYHKAAKDITGPPTPDSTLINGLGRYNGGPASDLAVISVTRGKRYRFRLISMSCDPNFNFTIDGHEMTVIEADGVNTEPLRVEAIQIFAAQRYSFILNANQAIGNYWIRALPSTVPNATYAGGLNSAILRYVGAPSEEPKTKETPTPVWLSEVDLHPLQISPVPGKHHHGGADMNILLNFTLADSANGGTFLVNGVSFVSPNLPVLLQILNGRRPEDLLPRGSIYRLPRNATVELQMPGGVPRGGHPIHLHGHNFWVVQSAGSKKPNYKNPVIRDTVNIGTSGDNVTIRFRTDNPGPWFLHCHIDFHLATGFAAVFAEDIEETKAANAVPPEWDKLCPAYEGSGPREDL